MELKMLKKCIVFLLSLCLLLLLIEPNIHMNGEEEEYMDTTMYVNEQHIQGIASSIPVAETWVKERTTNMSGGTPKRIIVVGGGFLCNPQYEDYWNMILPATQNLYFSLVRLSLTNRVKVSTFISTHCLQNPHNPSLSTFKEHYSQSQLKPLLNFLQNTNSSYALHPATSYQCIKSHENAIKQLGLSLKMDLLPKRGGIRRRRKSRKLVVVVEPYPARPSPLPEIRPSSPTDSPTIRNSVPARIAPLFSPIPPNTKSPPPFSFTYSPEHAPPITFPTNPPDENNNPAPSANGPYLGGAGGGGHGSSSSSPTPCGAAPTSGKEPKAVVYEVWCVAKPSVPDETLQQAMDYACGDGGGECEEIMPLGRCYYPNTIAAHASYAFNSYWQKTKNDGGTCDFSGAAMLITSDPSFAHCHFNLS